MNLEKLVEHEDLLIATFERGYAKGYTEGYTEGYTNGTEDAEYTAQVERNNEY